jgi:hypothetical protein
MKAISRIPVSLLVILACSVGLGCIVGHEMGPVAGVICVPVTVAFMAVPSLPFATQWGVLGILPPELARMISSNAEINLDELARMWANLRAEVNSMLQGLPPLEQFETAPELTYGLRTMRNALTQFLEMQEALSTAMQRYTAQATAKAEAAAEAKLIGTGDYVKKTDAETAQQAAVANKEKEIKDGLEAEKTTKAAIATQRSQLVTDKVCTELVANALSDDFFKADGYADRVTKLKARLKTLADNKLDKAEEFVKEMAGIGMDEAGDKTFDSRVNSIKSLVSSSASRAGGGSFVPAGASEENAESGEVVLCF